MRLHKYKFMQAYLKFSNEMDLTSRSGALQEEVGLKYNFDVTVALTHENKLIIKICFG